MISWGNDTSGQKDMGVDSVARESEAKPLSECARNLFNTVETCETLQPACLPACSVDYLRRHDNKRQTVCEALKDTLRSKI